MLKIIYNANDDSCNINVKSAEKRVRRWAKKFIDLGYVVKVEKFNRYHLLELKNLKIDASQENNPDKLCWLIIYDDQQQHKCLTNETLAGELFEDVVRLFKSRAYRQKQLHYLLAKERALGI
ncbi:TPA: hypothetical protein ACQ0F8_002045 [Streptococcus agalactiae]|nr:hypothetical protein [Streptococcus agalactiae]